MKQLFTIPLILLTACSPSAFQIEKPQHKRIEGVIADTTFPKKIEKPKLSEDYQPQPEFKLR